MSINGIPAPGTPMAQRAGGHPSSKTFGDDIADAVAKVQRIGKRCIDSIVAVLVMIKDNPSVLIKGFKIIIFSVIGARHLRHDPTLAAPLTNQLGRTINLIDTFGVVPDAKYFIDKDYAKPEHNLLESIGNGCFLAADVGGLVLWGEELDLYKIGNVSTATPGASPFTFSQVLTGIATVAFAFIGASAIQKLVQEYSKKISNPADIRQGWIDLAWSIAEVVSKVFLLAGLTSIAFYGTLGLLLLGTGAALLGIVSFVHRQIYERQFAHSV